MARAQRGFTLVELMIVVTIIGLLAAIAVPSVRSAMREARLNEATPYLLDIASRMRSYKYRHGKYCCDADLLDESKFAPELGVDIAETGNFCFVVICRDSSLCEKTVSTSFITGSDTGDPTVEFEVWAILRDTTTSAVNGPRNAVCHMDPNAKRDPTGWVAAASSGDAAREGRAVAYRYPAPPNGRDTVTGDDGVTFTWTEGISTTHALTP